MKQTIFSFSRATAWRIVKKSFPDLSPHYFRMNRILKQGGYYTAAEEFGLAINNRTRDSKEWIQIKNRCLSTFGNICPVTGKTNRLQVHHIDFNRMNNHLENLIPLWAKYHRLIHARADFSEDYKEADRTFLLSLTKIRR